MHGFSLCPSLVHKLSPYGLRLSSRHSRLLGVFSGLLFKFTFFLFNTYSTSNRWEKGHLLAAVQHHRDLVVTGNYTISHSYVTFAGRKICYRENKNISLIHFKGFQEVICQIAQCEKAFFSVKDKNILFLQTASSPYHNEPCRLKLDQIAEGLGKHQLHFYADLLVHPSWN